MATIIPSRVSEDFDNTEVNDQTQLLNDRAQHLDAQPASSQKLPKSIYYILPSEFCDKYSYYATKVFFNQYLKTGFGLSDGVAKAMVHSFAAIVYLLPLLGAALSDSYLGKYKTIVLGSVFSIIGCSLLSIFSINGLLAKFGEYPIWSFNLATILICIGTGGTKPCVSPHGADQFDPHQEILLERYFTLYTMVLALAFVTGVAVLPYVKGTVDCFGVTCYPLMFGVPALLTLLGLLIFIGGRKYYRVEAPQNEFLPWKVIKLLFLTFKTTGIYNWNLDAGIDTFGVRFVTETRRLLQAALIISPLIFEYMLEGQADTEWQNQYEGMNKYQLNLIYVPTEACSILSAFLVIFFVWILGVYIYPGLAKRGIKFPLTHRVGLGYFLCILGFLCSIVLEHYVQLHSTSRIFKGGRVVECENCLNGAWQFPQWILLSLSTSLITPNATALLYAQVGTHFKSFAQSTYLSAIGLGNLLVLALELPLRSAFANGVYRQLVYLLISSCGLLLYIVLLKFWFNKYSVTG